MTTMAGQPWSDGNDLGGLLGAQQWLKVCKDRRAIRFGHCCPFLENRIGDAMAFWDLMLD